jgi:hypothetical protein
MQIKINRSIFSEGTIGYENIDSHSHKKIWPNAFFDYNKVAELHELALAIKVDARCFGKNHNI